MRNIKDAPKFERLDFKRLDRIIPLLSNPELQQTIAKANKEYLHWEKIKHLPPPEDMTPEDVWFAVRLSRSSKTPIAMNDKAGKAFWYWPPCAQQTLHEVDLASGGLFLKDEVNAVHREQVLISSLMEEAIATSQIEGAVTTRKRAKEMLSAGTKPKNKSEQMIVNSYRTIRMLKERTDVPLTIELLHEIQRLMTENTLDEPEMAGKFRRPDDEISVWDNVNEELVFIPPPAEELPKRMGVLIKFANEKSDGADFIHPLVKAAILHFWLAYEHPYIDGNGRTARAIFYWFMLKNKYWLFEYLSISAMIRNSRTAYYRSFLYSEYDDNDLSYSITYMIQVTHKALEGLRSYIIEKSAEQARISQQLRHLPELNLRQKNLLSDAIKRPAQIYSFQIYKTMNGISYQTARTDLLDLSKRGFLEIILSGKKIAFCVSPDLEAKLSKKKK